MTFMWHYRLGHINEKHIKKLHEDGLLDNFNIKIINTCESYLRGKIIKASFSKKGERTSDYSTTLILHKTSSGCIKNCCLNKLILFYVILAS
jgi:GAG-pre-integrase domain